MTSMAPVEIPRIIDHQLSFLNTEGVRLALERAGYTTGQDLRRVLFSDVNCDGDHVYHIWYANPDAEGGEDMGCVYVRWGDTGPVADF
jgi:hypothetical protein